MKVIMVIRLILLLLSELIFEQLLKCMHSLKSTDFSFDFTLYFIPYGLVQALLPSLIARRLVVHQAQ